MNKTYVEIKRRKYISQKGYSVLICGLKRRKKILKLKYLITISNNKIVNPKSRTCSQNSLKLGGFVWDIALCMMTQ